ncbi:Bcr/CflA family drug resistance efflux transporter [Celeribacter ethanolicus]|uniref:Bcr/CflA family efflux transporter n=1 Tax=Celeribacter ethanolicus TaxID=1758178 RepID=A0A291GH70_9RHOB|nr:multidrug effflux MFS transporter [Celeribacter ethanolicus]ATG49508.1 Bcr/CflA family drug resistance efflux transporter [Celeribacter ethanolicus]
MSQNRISSPDRTPSARLLDRRTPPHILTLVLMAGVSAMTMNVFLPALPEMTDYFGTDYSVMQLSIAIFLAVNAGLQLVIGPLSDRFGRRPVLIGGILIFLAATLGAIYAPSAQAFLLMRAAQAGIVSAMVLSRAIVRDMVPGEEAAQMIAYVTMGMSLVPMVAPTVGGFLTHIYGWQSAFWLLFGVGFVLLLLVTFDAGETAPKTGGSMKDMLRGFPELLTSQRFLGYALSAATASGAYFAFLGGAPFLGSTVFNLTEDKLGLYMAAPAIGYFFGNFIAGRYSARFGMNTMILIGAGICALGVFVSLLTFLADRATPMNFFAMISLLGAGNGLQLPNSIAGSLSVRPHLAGTAAGLGGFMYIGGGAVLSAFAGSVLSPESGGTPLLVIMLCASLSSIAAALWVVLRERKLIREG